MANINTLFKKNLPELGHRKYAPDAYQEYPAAVLNTGTGHFSQAKSRKLP